MNTKKARHDRWIALVSFFACMFVFAQTAHAQDAANADKTRLDVSIGLKGGLNGSFAAEEVPEDSAIFLGSQGYSIDPELYPLFGFGGDVGLSIDARLLGIVGIETGVRLSFDNGEGWNDKKDATGDRTLARIYQTQSSTSFRIPLLLKLSSATGTVRPVFGIGIEFVNQIDSTIEYRGESRAADANSFLFQPQTWNKIEPSSYLLGKVALGLEINVDRVRIPIEISGQYNMGFKNEFSERTRYEGTSLNDLQIYYDGAFQGHFNISIGVIYNTELFL